jgi:hypothetical protein
MSGFNMNNFDISNFDMDNFDVDKFNNLVTQTSDTIMCDANCQKTRKASNLEQDYLDAQTNLYTAPSKLETAEKNYYTFKVGSSAYSEIKEFELLATVEKITDDKTTKFDNKAAQIQTQIDSYNGLFLNLKNVYELYDKYKTRNLELLDELKDETNDVLTNERKTYYEDQGIDSLKFYYYYFLLTIYILCVITFVGFSLIYPSHYSIYLRIFVFIFLIFLPFASANSLATLIYLCEEAYKLLPKNVYKTI